MAEPFVFKINNPPETADSIASKLNSKDNIVDVTVIRNAVSQTDLANQLSRIKAEVNDNVDRSYKKSFSHIEATYARGVGNTKKMSDLRYHGGGTVVTVSAIAPSNPKLNDLWFDVS